MKNYCKSVTTTKNKKTKKRKKKKRKAISKESIRLLCSQRRHELYEKQRGQATKAIKSLLIFILILKITFPKSVLHKNFKFYFLNLFNYLGPFQLIVVSKLYAWYAERAHRFQLRSTKKSGKREKFKLF